MKKFKCSKKVQAIALAILFIPLFSTCKDDKPEPPKSDKKELTNVNIKVAGQTWSAQSKDGKNFEFLAPLVVNGVLFNQDLLREATIEFTIPEKATSDPQSGARVNLTQDLTITVTAEDETIAQYIVKKSDGTSDEKFFVSFSVKLGEKNVDCEIDGTTFTVFIPRPKLEDMNLLQEVVPTFTLSVGAIANPQTGVKQTFVKMTDIEDPDDPDAEPQKVYELLSVEYEITAHDQSKQKWTVEVRGRSNADVDVFYLDFYENPQADYEWRGEVQMVADINKETQTITYVMPVLPTWFTKNHMTVFPAVIQISEGATVEPGWDVPQDFSKDVVYTVTAEDGTTKREWTVKAPAFYIKEKWSNEFTVYNENLDLNANSIAIIGDYLTVSRERTPKLINKSDGTISNIELNITDVWKGNAVTEPAEGATHRYPFFVTNDDKGNLIAGSLNAWRSDVYTLFKWKSATEAPEVLMEFPTISEGAITSGHGRKLQVLGDINGKGLIIAPNVNTAGVDAAILKSKGEHFMWKIEGGNVNLTPVKVQTNIRWDNSNYGYQLLTPLGLEPVSPYYVGSHAASEASDEKNKYPNVYFGEIGAMEPIAAPFGKGTGVAQGYGDAYYLYHKLFTFSSKNMIATFSGAWSNYYFAVMERTADNKHVTLVAHVIPYVAEGTSEAPGPGRNTNGTGSMTMEVVGNDIFFYLLPTNKGVYCYQMSKF